MISLEQKSNINSKIEDLDKKIRIFSMIRFVLVVAIIVFVICLITLNDPLLYTILSVGFLAVMILFCTFTNPFYHELKILKNLELVYKKHENRRKLSYHSFTPDGKEFIDYNHYMELDLDVLGPRSLFQYLCCAKSKEGRRKLATQLTKPVAKPEEFRECVSYLASKEESLRLEASILAIPSEAKDCEIDEIIGITNKKIKIPVLGIALMILSYIALITLLIVLLVLKIQAYFLLFFIPLNYIIVRFFNKNEIFDIASEKYFSLLDGYQKLENDVLALSIEDSYFKALQEKLKKEAATLAKFKGLFDMLSYRKNVILSIFGNGIFYLDFLIAAIFNQRTKKLASIQESLDALSEIELLVSLAIIGLDNEVTCKPSFSNILEVKDGFHPLVRNCIPNDFKLQRGTILTGSNMSGKTTFMRMLGINQLLANAGGIVCAKEFSTIANLKIVTSLRATDVLQEGISTFYAEVNHMKNIMITSRNEKTLVLVDEIFKGTNAKDRIYAALKIIDKLNHFNVPFIITTHDFELCDAKDIINFHFDEQYEDDKILFDYKIKEGKCMKTNAIYLLKMAGVLENGE